MVSHNARSTGPCSLRAQQVYRLYVVWSRNLYLVIVPAIMALLIARKFIL